jgi:hypothetical protein
MSDFTARVFRERAILARDDPDGERDAVVPLTHRQAVATIARDGALRHENGGPLIVLDWAAILAEPPIPLPMLEGTPIPKVGVTVLAGPPKIGKSIWASQLALVRHSTIIAEEGSLAAIGYRLRLQATALAVTDPAVVLIHRQRVRLDDPAAIARLHDHVTERRPELVVFDPLNRLHGSDENSPALARAERRDPREQAALLLEATLAQLSRGANREQAPRGSRAPVLRRHNVPTEPPAQ